MATKPTKNIDWATTGGTTVEPSAGQKAAGFAVSTKPPARWVNWLFNLVKQWIDYLDAPVGTGSGAGIDATGGSSDGSGLKGTGGATNGIGVEGVGAGNGEGVKGTGGSSDGIGVEGVGGGSDGIGVKGTSPGAGPGVYGASNGIGGQFVGSINGPGVHATGGAQTGAHGVYGIGGNATGSHGVHGYVYGGTAYGLSGLSEGGTGGVLGKATDGYGVVAEGDTTSPAKAAFRIVPQDAAPTGANAVGDIYVTTAGIPYICTSAGTPGTWTKISAT